MQNDDLRDEEYRAHSGGAMAAIAIVLLVVASIAQLHGATP
jgi:hypothetical protein